MPLIEIKNLKKIYNVEGVETVGIHDVTFSVDTGSFVSIMGPSGSGKSTLLHILGFLDRQTSGEYRFDSKTIDEYSDDGLARVRNKKMGFVFQAFNLLPRLTVMENTKLPLLYSGIKENLWNEMATKALESVGLGHRLNHPASKLSGGETQRAAIARALVNNPQVIFADEPTGNLDSKSGQTVIEILQELNESQGHTIILITHETSIAEYAERIIHIKDGTIEKDEPVKNRLKAREYFIK